jgi:hypothetical protein
MLVWHFVLLDLSLLSYSYSLYELITQEPVTCFLVLNCSCRCNCLCNWLFRTVPLDCRSERSQTLVTHPLKRVFCRLSREYLLEGLSWSVHENISVVQETSLSVTLGIPVCLCRYNGNTSVCRLGKDVSKLSPLILLTGILSQWYMT